MAKQKLKEKKKKAKERAKHKEKLARQEAVRKDAKVKLEEALAADDRPKLQPIRRDPRRQAILENLRALKAIEAEYIKNEKARQNLNESLESEGYSTLEEKLEALKAKTQEAVAKIQAEFGDFGDFASEPEASEIFQENSESN